MTTEELLKPRWKVIADFPGRYRTGIKVGDVLIPKEIDQPETYFVADYYVNLSHYPAIFRKLGWWEERDEKDMPKYVRYKGCEMFRLNSPKMGEVLKVDNYQEDYLNHNKGCDWISLYEPATEQEYLNQ